MLDMYRKARRNRVADSQGRIYIGTEPGGLFHSDDDGGSFH